MNVFHPGHDDLHGQTVVLFTDGPRTYVGRWNAQEGDGILMMGASVHDTSAGDEGDGPAWVETVKQYGFGAEHASLVVPADEVTRVVRLRDA